MYVCCVSSRAGFVTENREDRDFILSEMFDKKKKKVSVIELRESPPPSSRHSPCVLTTQTHMGYRRRARERCIQERV
jgi:hypothetical protein